MNSKICLVSPKRFQNCLLKWFDSHGRTDLPWQQDRTPYRVYLSEVMLQQTQVSTVIPYFERFIERFPDLETLANAPLDDILHLWAGLGYYSRAKNIYRTAQIIRDQYAGRFPNTYDALVSLPGIGPSTAGAILAISFKQPYPILDGNVKRVLSRVAAVEGAPNDRQVINTLWALSRALTPNKRVDAYTQAMMDLGATVCTQRNPSCHQCPMNHLCQAFNRNQVEQFPHKKIRLIKRSKSIRCLIIVHRQHLLLHKRPLKGIWGGLWSLPECALNRSADTWLNQQFDHPPLQTTPLPAFRHVLTHFNLDLHPILCQVTTKHPAPSSDYAWIAHNKLAELALPAPIKRLLANWPIHA